MPRVDFSAGKQDEATTTDTSIVARVAAALSTDPRTDVVVVGIINERGVVTLTGEVNDPGTREAAEEIARRQPGVTDVINNLEVRIDDITDLPSFRVMLQEQRKQKPNLGIERIDD